MAIEDAAKRLTGAGALLGDAVPPAGFEALSEAREAFNEFERARAMAHEWHADRGRISARLARSIQNGMAMPWPRYLEARRVVAEWRARLDELFGGFDVLLAPCVPGEAPEGLGHTGDPRMQGIWTLLHTPTITLPTHRGPKGLPVGIQLVGKIGADEGLLAASRWVWNRLGPSQ
jgi:Asp-tRNA(Asn)/Glu-tRNA(Gln) amidotransferase A subunit family amidase